jgi:hypothetical protein
MYNQIETVVGKRKREITGKPKFLKIRIYNTKHGIFKNEK